KGGCSPVGRSSPSPSIFVNGLTALRLHLTPELVVGDPACFLDLASRLVEQCLELRRMCQQQPFQLVIVRDRQQHGDGLAVPSDYDGAFLRLLQVSAQARFDVRDRGNLHSSNSSSPKKRRLRSLTPMASTRTWPLSALI